MKRQLVWGILSLASCTISINQVLMGVDGSHMLIIGLILLVLATVESKTL